MAVFTAGAVLFSGIILGFLLNACVTLMTAEKPAGEISLKAGRSVLFPVGKGKRRLSRFWTIEILNTGLYLGLLAAFSISPQFFLYGAFFSALIVISFVDLEQRVIYTGVNLFIALIGLLACFVSPLPAWYERPAGLLAASLPLLLIFMLSRGGMGMGDVELAAASGLLLGWQLSIVALILAGISSSIVGIVYGLVKGTGLKTAIPFGPFLAFGFISAVFLGSGLMLIK